MTILQALDHYYDRMMARGEAAPAGYSLQPIGAVLVLSTDGTLVDVQIRYDASGKKPKPELVPKWFARSGKGSTPFFLWENTAYALGIGIKEPQKTQRDHAAFKALHFATLTDDTDIGLTALRLFLERWTPSQFNAPLFDDRFFSWNVAFSLDGEQRLIHQRPAAIAHVERLRAILPSQESTFCLVTGRMAPPVRLHPKIKGVDGTASAEVPLVSFNEGAFESYGKTQGLNAPTSEKAASRYGEALNRLLDRGTSRNRIKIADTTLVFWADASGLGQVLDKEKVAEAAEDFFSALFNPSTVETDTAGLDLDKGEAAKIRAALEDVAKGKPLKDVHPKLEEGTRFHVLGLSPNAARLSVRYWLDDSFGVFAKRLAMHHVDLAIEPRPRGFGFPSVQRLLVKTTALQEKFDNIPPLLAGEVMRAILTGDPYPRSLMIAVILRLRAGDNAFGGWHAAVIKACLNRTEKEDAPMALDPDNTSVPYQLGRLFAVLESAQYEALDKVNASIADRYYGSASSTPARVFGSLLRGLQNHVSDAKKRGKGGWIDGKVGKIMLKLPPDLPRTLRLEDQGRFAIGYYHERATYKSKQVAKVTEEGGVS